MAPSGLMIILISCMFLLWIAWYFRKESIFAYAFSYYFANGNVALESVDVDQKYFDEENHSYNYTFSGDGYFRMVYRGAFYVLQYKMKDSHLEGSLSIWA